MSISKNNKNNLLKPLIIGFISSVIVTLIVIIMGAVAATNLNVSDTGILVIALISMSIGAFFGGFIAAKINKEKGFLVGALNGFLFFFITTIIAFAVNAESMTIISLIKLILFILTSMIGGVFGVNFSRKRKFNI